MCEAFVADKLAEFIHLMALKHPVSEGLCRYLISLDHIAGAEKSL